MSFLIFMILFLHIANARNKLKNYNGKIHLLGRNTSRKL